MDKPEYTTPTLQARPYHAEGQRGVLRAQLWIQQPRTQIRHRYSLLELPEDQYRIFEDAFDPKTASSGIKISPLTGKPQPAGTIFAQGKLIREQSLDSILAAWNTLMIDRLKEGHGINRGKRGMVSPHAAYARFNLYRAGYGHLKAPRWCMDAETLAGEDVFLSKTSGIGDAAVFCGRPAELAAWVNTGEWEHTFQKPIVPCELDF
jgi:hypothetical protein